MYPQLIIAIAAIVGAFVDGVAGFFIWGISGFIGVLAIGLVLTKFSGGILPRKVRDETATDFIVHHPELVQQAFPDNSPYEAKQKVAATLDAMYKRATINNPSFNLDVAGDPRVFLVSALEIAEEQPSEDLKEMARELVAFVGNHHLWYKHANL